MHSCSSVFKEKTLCVKVFSVLRFVKSEITLSFGNNLFPKLWSCAYFVCNFKQEGDALCGEHGVLVSRKELLLQQVVQTTKCDRIHVGRFLHACVIWGSRCTCTRGISSRLVIANETNTALGIDLGEHVINTTMGTSGNQYLVVNSVFLSGNQQDGNWPKRRVSFAPKPRNRLDDSVLSSNREMCYFQRRRTGFRKVPFQH